MSSSRCYLANPPNSLAEARARPDFSCFRDTATDCYSFRPYQDRKTKPPPIVLDRAYPVVSYRPPFNSCNSIGRYNHVTVNTEQRESTDIGATPTIAVQRPSSAAGKGSTVGVEDLSSTTQRHSTRVSRASAVSQREDPVFSTVTSAAESADTVPNAVGRKSNVERQSVANAKSKRLSLTVPGFEGGRKSSTARGSSSSVKKASFSFKTRSSTSGAGFQRGSVAPGRSSVGSVSVANRKSSARPSSVAK